MLDRITELVTTHRHAAELTADLIFLHRLFFLHHPCVCTSQNRLCEKPGQNNLAAHWPCHQGSQHHLQMNRHNWRRKSAQESQSYLYIWRQLGIFNPQNLRISLKIRTEENWKHVSYGIHFPPTPRPAEKQQIIQHETLQTDLLFSLQRSMAYSLFRIIPFL